jgi:hypothetical protein
MSSLTSTTTGSCLNVGAGTVGYLASSDAAQSCFMFTFNSGTFGNNLANGAVTFSGMTGGQTSLNVA